MLGLSFGILCAAVTLGVLLALAQGAPRLAARLWPVGLVHGLIGASGLAVLLAALRGPPRGVASGASGFGFAAAYMLGAALLMGLSLLYQRRRARAGVNMLMLSVHVGLAVFGFVLLAAYVSMPA